MGKFIWGNPAKRILGAFAFAGLMGACSMQAATQASFHLTAPTHWGNTVLPAGDYKVHILNQNAGPNELEIEGRGQTIYEMPVAVDPSATNRPGSLLIVEQEGESYVKEYRSGMEGKTYSFAVPSVMASHRRKSAEVAN